MESQALNEFEAELIKNLDFQKQLKTSLYTQARETQDQARKASELCEALEIQVAAIAAYKKGTELSPAAYAIGQEVITKMYRKQYQGTITDRAYAPQWDKWLYRAALTGDRLPSHIKEIVAAEYFHQDNFAIA